ncbi:MAG: pyridoxamine 5'-phosphate oxidase [Gemmataceae bacterium]|nr:pyridoxamine 5'-phosphate oxidase [Gemmata sp.]MDW8196662.1 pyridoxamine 5'-phosphate oxidase [Gemmataceae bacterium]
MSGTVQPNIADLRKEYSLAGLSEADAGDDPFALFHRWFSQAVAAELTDPNAMILATCTPQGRPSARAVLLKALDERGFTFFTNYESRKGHEMAANPHVALVFLWHQLERQVRVEGVVEKVSASESDEYYAKRPLGSRLGAWASPQSAVIPNREFLEKAHAELLARYPDGNPPRPPHWGGYRVIPEVIEFWQGRPSRLHDRIRFTRTPTGWKRERLAP